MLVSHSFNANFDVFFFPVVLWLWIRLPFATFFTAQERKRREAEEAESRCSPSGKEIGKNTMKTPTVSNRFPLDTFGP
jgi:hypothetical protein